jgi:acyl-CoA dehydrogenase
MGLPTVRLSPELDSLRATIKQFATDELSPHERLVDDRDEVPPELYRRLRKRGAELGIPGTQVPAEYGGMGLGCQAWAAVKEALGWTTQAMRCVVQPGGATLLLAGTEAQRQKYIPPVLSGDRICAFAVTEPGAGSDAAAMRTQAVRDGNYYVLNGTKHFITNGSIADYVVIFAVTDKEKRARGGITAFVVEKGTPGFTYGQGFHNVGWRGVPHSELIFQDCAVPVDNVLGEVGDGFRTAMRFLDSGRVGVAASCVGTAARMLELAIEYAKGRQTFGEPLVDRQAVQWMLADSAMEIHGALLMVYQTAEKIDRGERATFEAASTKLHASEMANRVVDRALQICGGIGLTTDLPIEIAFRDLRAERIGEGTSEMLRLVIARQVLK